MIYLPPFRGFVRFFVFACAIVFFVQLIFFNGPWANPEIYSKILWNLGLVPEKVFSGHVYQMLTWIFLHANLNHLLFNMLGFWMFGSMIEGVWGTRRFRTFCLLAGLATAVGICGMGLVDKPTFSTPTIGASGIVFAVIAASAVLFADQVMLFFFVFPMKMKYFALLMIAIEFIALWQAHGIMGEKSSSMSHIAHLSGALAGYILAKSGGWGGLSFMKDWRDRWRQKQVRKRLRVVKVNQKISYH